MLNETAGIVVVDNRVWKMDKQFFFLIFSVFSVYFSFQMLKIHQSWNRSKFTKLTVMRQWVVPGNHPKQSHTQQDVEFTEPRHSVWREGGHPHDGTATIFLQAVSSMAGVRILSIAFHIGRPWRHGRPAEQEAELASLSITDALTTPHLVAQAQAPPKIYIDTPNTAPRNIKHRYPWQPILLYSWRWTASIAKKQLLPARIYTS